MKITIEIRTGKAGTRTSTKVEGQPEDATERLVYDCLHAAINVGLDNAGELLNARGTVAAIPAAAKAQAAKIVSIHSGPLPEQPKQK